jgi:hypothetical protein
MSPPPENTEVVELPATEDIDHCFFITELSTFANVTGESCKSSWVCTATAKQALRINASHSLFLLLRAVPMW